jgi:hypothetical protein
VVYLSHPIKCQNGITAYRGLTQCRFISHLSQITIIILQFTIQYSITFLTATACLRNPYITYLLLNSFVTVTEIKLTWTGLVYVFLFLVRFAVMIPNMLLLIYITHTQFFILPEALEDNSPPPTTCITAVSPLCWPVKFNAIIKLHPHRWCLHLIVVVGFACSWDPESYAGGSVSTGRITHAGQVKG